MSKRKKQVVAAGLVLTALPGIGFLGGTIGEWITGGECRIGDSFGCDISMLLGIAMGAVIGGGGAACVLWERQPSEANTKRPHEK